MTNVRSLASTTLTWLIGTGILLVLAGGYAIYAPFTAGLAADATIAALLIIGGIAHFVLAWKLREIGGSLWESLVGIAYILGGILLIAYPVTGLVALTTILTIYLFLSAVTELLAYYNLRFIRGSGWLLINGIITFILAIMLFARLPSSAMWLPGTFVGVAMLSSGLSRLFLAFTAKRLLTESVA